jgi:hypothetical protein
MSPLPTDPEMSAHVIHAHIDWCLGDPSGANFHAARANEVAAALPAEGAPDLPSPFRGVFRDFNRAGALAFQSWLLGLQEDYEGAAEAGRTEQEIAGRYADGADAAAFANYDPLGRLHGGYAEAMAAGQDVIAAARRLEGTLDEYLVTGASGTSYILWTIGSLYYAGGDHRQALAAADRGLVRVEEAGERYFESDLLALRGLARSKVNPASARGDFEAAMRTAELRGSVPLRLRAARQWALADEERGRSALAAVLPAAEKRVSDHAFAAARALLET